MKKRKLDTSPLQCEYILPKKNRKCKMLRKQTSTSKYCPEHQVLESTDNNRIACPLDPTHSVWENELEKHLIKCNKYKLENEPYSEPWFKQNHNSISDDKHYSTLDIDYKDWVSKVEEAYEMMLNKGVKSEIDFEVKRDPGVAERFSQVTNQKHIVQQASLIGHLKDNNLDSGCNYVEFGCGRAELSRYLSQSQMSENKQAVDYLLIDRSPVRMKLDGKIVKDWEYGSGTKCPLVKRIKIDIRDLDLDKALEQFEGKYAGISKHLCGCATDLTLQCIMNSDIASFAGLVVAMCCRHVCRYDYFLAESKQFLASVFDKDVDLAMAFKVLTKLVSWATNGRREDMKDTDIQASSGLSVSQREKVGLKARRLIDESRVYALQQKGFNARICHYVDKSVSLENVCLIVTQK